MSDLSRRKAIRFLQISLTGTVSNRQALGARVTVRSGGRTLVKWNDGKSGYLSQSALPIYFGLGDAEKVDRVEVLWPSGRQSLIDRGIAINRVLTVREPL
jgi:hypothetical protein